MHSQPSGSFTSVEIFDDAQPIIAKVKFRGGDLFRSLKASVWLNSLLRQDTGQGEIVDVTIVGDFLMLEMSELVLDKTAAIQVVERFELVLSTQYDSLGAPEKLLYKGSDFNPMAVSSESLYDPSAGRY